MTDVTGHAQPRMPNIGRLLAAQIGYQGRLLASGRAVTIGIGLPIILLLASHQSRTQTTDADVASYAVFGLTLTAWNTYGVRLVATREAGILKRWWATPLPRWCTPLRHPAEPYRRVRGTCRLRSRESRLGRRGHRPHDCRLHDRSCRADLSGHLLPCHHHLRPLRCH
jgi:hypothetical protein